MPILPSRAELEDPYSFLHEETSPRSQPCRHTQKLRKLSQTLAISTTEQSQETSSSSNSGSKSCFSPTSSDNAHCSNLHSLVEVGCGSQVIGSDGDLTQTKPHFDSLKNLCSESLLAFSAVQNVLRQGWLHLRDEPQRCNQALARLDTWT